MRDVLVMLFESFGLCWLALIVLGLTYSLVRWLRTPTPPWWALDESARDHQAALEQARREYVTALRQSPPPQPVRDELLKLTGQLARGRSRELRQVSSNDAA